jgi:hypothetical protein
VDGVKISGSSDVTRERDGVARDLAASSARALPVKKKKNVAKEMSI